MRKTCNRITKTPQKRYPPPRPYGSVWSPAGRGLTSWLLFVMSNCDFVTFPYGILGQAWYLIVLIPVLCRLSYLYQDTLLTPDILKLGNFPDSFDAVRKDRASDAHGGVFIAYIDFEMYMCSRRLIKRFTRSFWVSQPWELIRRQQEEGVTCKYLMGYKKTVSAATFGYYRRALSNSSYKHTNAQ